MIQRALREELLKRGVDREVVTVVTEVEVDADDDAFEEPTKPVGRFYSKTEADGLSEERGWRMMEDAGRGYRRVVPSPVPVRIVQLPTIRALIEDGVVVVCCGGGGIPVTRRPDGGIDGLAAVIDKDRASALLGVRLQAKRLVITTGIDAVYRDFQTDHRQRLTQMNVEEVRALAREGQFPPGSMRPKMEAAIYFVRRCPGEAIICSPDQLLGALRGEAGTRVTKE